MTSQGCLEESTPQASSAEEDAELLASQGYNLTDQNLADDGFQYDWERARERARVASLLRESMNSQEAHHSFAPHWERMSSSVHLNYDWRGVGLTTSNTRWIFSDFVSSKVAKHQYYATISHRKGYVGYQSKAGLGGHVLSVPMFVLGQQRPQCKVYK